MNNIDDLYVSFIASLKSEKKVDNKQSAYFYDLSIWNYSSIDHVVSRVDDIDVSDWFKSDTIHRIFLNSSLSIDFCIMGTEYYSSAKSCLVCFSGAVAGDRSNKPAPILSGASVSADLQMPLVSIADPTMALTKEINLGWYAGNYEIPNLMAVIAQLLDKINEAIKKKMILFGGSGGGFASMAVAQLMSKTVHVCTVNPQTQIENYVAEHVKKYLLLGYEIDKTKYSTNFDANDLQLALNQYVLHHDLNRGKFHSDTKILYLQNYTDSHTVDHAIPFLKNYSMIQKGKSIFVSSNGQIGLYLGHWGEGHAAAPKDILYDALKSLDHSEDFDNLLHFLDSINQTEISPKFVLDLANKHLNISLLEKIKDIDFYTGDKINFSRDNCEDSQTITIELNLASSKDSSKRELLYSVDYFNKLERDAIIKMGYAESNLPNVGYFKYIFTKPNEVYTFKITLEFPSGISLMGFSIRNFFPTGKTVILNSKVYINLA